MKKCYFALPAIAALAAASFTATPARAQDIDFLLPLAADSGSKMDMGLLSGGTTLHLTFTGHGDLVDSRYQTLPDGSMFAPAQGAYTFANPGQPYPSTYNGVNYGGDGTNHFPGGGANVDFTGSGFGFASKLSLDTTDASSARHGAVVGTFAVSPQRSDWFLIGTDAAFVVPAQGAHLYLAVNDSVNGDNHGTYAGHLAKSAAPAPASLPLFALGMACVGLRLRRRTVALHGK